MKGHPVRASVATVRAVSYHRVIVVDGHRPSNLERRVRRLAAFATSQPGWALVGGYADVGDGQLDRPGLSRLVADATAGWFDVVVVDDLDRLARDPRRSAAVVRHLAAVGVRVQPVSGRADRRGAAALVSGMIAGYVG